MLLMLALVVVLALMILWKYYYLRKEDAIASVPIDAMTPDLIRRHRIPYVIEELLPEPRVLLTTLFKYAYLFSRTKVADEMPIEFKTTAMYTLVYSTEDGSHVDVHRQGDKMRILMNQGRVVIVPPQWHVSMSRNVTAIQLYDPISLPFVFL